MRKAILNLHLYSALLAGLFLIILGLTGPWIVTVATFFVPLLIITGIYLWWPLKRATIRPGSSWRQLMFDSHSAAGIYSGLFLVVLALTGIAISLDGWWAPKAYAM